MKSGAGSLYEGDRLLCRVRYEASPAPEGSQLTGRILDFIDYPGDLDELLRRDLARKEELFLILEDGSRWSITFTEARRESAEFLGRRESR